MNQNNIRYLQIKLHKIVFPSCTYSSFSNPKIPFKIGDVKG